MAESISVRQLLTLTAEQLREVPPENFEYVRAKDLAQLWESQLLALTPEQVKALRPASFVEIDPEWLKRLLDKIDAEAPPDEQDVEVRTEINPQGKEVRREYYGARETLRRAIPKAQKAAQERERQKALREQDGMVDDNFIRADVVAAKLDISMRFMYILGEEGEISMVKVSGRYLCELQSVLDYLNRRRVPGAVLDEAGKPIMLLDAETGEPMLREDPSGKMKPAYEQVELEELTEIPLLCPTEYFAEKLAMDPRSFVRNCNAGFYDHFQIGTNFKMSEEDFTRSILRMHEATKKRSAGRSRKSC